MREDLKTAFNYGESGCRDGYTNDHGWYIFYYFYGNRDKQVSLSNPWRLNLGKFVFPNIFVESMLIRELGKSYHP